MTLLTYITTLTIASLLVSCNGLTNKQKDDISQTDSLAQKEKSKEAGNLNDFVKNYNGENNRLFVFVGHKISVDDLPNRKGSMDGSFKAKYLVTQKVFGDFSNDTIEFVAYDHYGIPAFSKYEDVLLFVSADSGTYYHQKYQYNDVYKTKDGRWAGAYAWDDFEHEYNKKTKIKPVKIDFAKTVYYPLKMVTEQGDTLKRNLPKPYFKKVGDSAIAIYGNYINDLFILKRDGVLTARKIFNNGKLHN